MKYRELKSDERRFFDDNGYLVVREALDEEMLQRVVEAADRLVAGRYTETGGRRASLSNVVALEDTFVPLLTWETTVPLIVQLLSYNIRLTKSHLIFKYPDPEGASEPTYWHRDVRYSSEDLKGAGLQHSTADQGGVSIERWHGARLWQHLAGCRQQ